MVLYNIYKLYTCILLLLYMYIKYQNENISEIENLYIIINMIFLEKNFHSVHI